MVVTMTDQHYYWGAMAPVDHHQQKDEANTDTKWPAKVKLELTNAQTSSSINIYMPQVK